MDTEKIWEKIEKKVGRMAPVLKDGSPCDYKDGRWNDNSFKVYQWTHTFWCGILWTLYADSKKEIYREYAESIEKRMDNAFLSYDELHHDVGFIWLLSSVKNFELTGNEQSRKRAMLAASVLASRYNIRGKYIRAWNLHNPGWAIIDCMMNIPILFWASRQLGDPRFANIAVSHADTVIQNFVREDGSVCHIVEFDPETGEKITSEAGQGCGKNSSWSRGQAWALYGFIQCYKATGNVRYLDTAKKIAHYFISCICDTWIPRCDFRQPAECTLTDTSAGAVAASGLIDIAEAAEENEKSVYLSAAENIIRTFDEKCADWEDGSTPILRGACRAYADNEQVGLIYGDYYFAEAVDKLRKYRKKIR